MSKNALGALLKVIKIKGQDSILSFFADYFEVKQLNYVSYYPWC